MIINEALSPDAALLVQGAVFLVVLFVVLHALREAPSVADGARIPFAVAFSLLCIFGLRGGFGDYEAIALPYVAFAITVTVLLVLLGVLWCVRCLVRRSREHRGRVLDRNRRSRRLSTSRSDQ